MANARPVTRPVHRLDRTCLVPPGRVRRTVGGQPVRLVAVAAALMVLVAAGLIAAVTVGASAGLVLGLAAVAVSIRPLAILAHRRRA